MLCGESNHITLCSKNFNVFFLSKGCSDDVDVSGVNPEETADILSECGLAISLNVSNYSLLLSEYHLFFAI